MSDLDLLLGDDGDEPARRSRGRAAVTTFALAVVTALIGVVLVAVLLYGAGVGAAALWEYWFGGFG